MTKFRDVFDGALKKDCPDFSPRLIPDALKKSVYEGCARAAEVDYEFTEGEYELIRTMLIDILLNNPIAGHDLRDTPEAKELLLRELFMAIFNLRGISYYNNISKDGLIGICIPLKNS